MRRHVAKCVLIGGLVAMFVGASAATSGPSQGRDKLDLLSAPMAELAAGGGTTGRGGPPRVGSDVQVNDPQAPSSDVAKGRSETTITGHGQKLVVGWNDVQGACGPPLNAQPSPCTPQSPTGAVGYGYSTDGGKTWTDGGGPDLFGGVFSRGDPWMDDTGEHGNTFYYANLAVHATTGASLGVGVWRGGFNGSSFAWDDVKTFDSPDNPGTCFRFPAGVTPIPCDFYDKEAIVAGKDTQKENAYVSVTNFQGQPQIGACGPFGQFGYGEIEVWSTHDGGDTYTGPAVPGPEAPDSVASCGFEGTLQSASVPAIGPRGEVYVVWQYGPTFDAAGNWGGGATIRFNRSLNGGASFGTPVDIVSINSSRANPPIGYNRFRVNDHPRIDVAQSGAYKGRIYVTYYSSETPVPSVANPPIKQVLVNIRTYVTHSDDRGATWSTPVEVGGPLPAGSAATKRWWPDVAVSPGGEVHVVYYEELAKELTPGPDVECRVRIDGGLFRTGPYSSVVDTWWTYSKDGGATFSMPLKLSSVTSVWCTDAANGGNVFTNLRPNMGDYIDAEAGPGLKVYGTWADGRNKLPDTFFAAGKS